MKLPVPSSPRKSRRPHGPRKGIALITVLALLAIVTLLVISFLSLAKVEYVSANHYSDGIHARALAEATTNLVVDQIWGATKQGDKARDVESWISQPGALRRYGQDGAFSKGYKLYSDSEMVVENEADLVYDAPPDDWDEQPARYVDLNAPVVRPGELGTREVTFPIVDPRAYYDDLTTPLDDRVEGFSYRETTSGADTGDPINGVVLPGDTDDPDDLRVPMPVEWLYTLRDGTIGHLDEDNRFIPADRVSADNPIVGRVAFWADDETSKLNINTASEPTFWSAPFAYHELSGRWALSQPARREFQRYPGHPATTALSPVLFPNAGINYLDTYNKPEVAKKAAEIKEQIYKIIPKINGGGSLAGTRNITSVTGVDNVSSLIANVQHDDLAAVDLSISRRDRLYATLDEFILGADRNENVFPSLDGNLKVGEIDNNVIERGKFFLTANSRAPETNLFNLPRVSMWPVHRYPEDGGVTLRSQFDEVIAFCSTANGWPYYIQRENADSPSDDPRLLRNREIVAYLDQLTDAKVPGYGGSFGADGRYGAKGEKAQIIAEIVDYIRSVNLHDDSLVDTVVDIGTSRLDQFEPPAEGDFATYTNPRWSKRFTPNQNQVNSLNYDWDQVNELNAFAGHGQVTPGHYDIDGTEAMGFGRFYTISEVALHFIASADAGGDGEYADGGAHDEESDVKSYSNIPPLSQDMKDKIQFAVNNHDKSGLPAQTFRRFSLDTLRKALPGQNGTAGSLPRSEFWNYCLETDTPLRSGRKKIQAAMLLEFFSPSAGWTQIVGDFHVRVKNLHNIKFSDIHGTQTLFPDNEVAISSVSLRNTGSSSRPRNRYYHYGLASYANGSHRGGSAGFRGFLRFRRVPKREPLPADGASGVNDILSYPLVSNFFEVDRDQPLDLTVDGPITIEIHSGAAGKVNDLQPNLVQSIDILFNNHGGGDPSFPSPKIVAENRSSISGWRNSRTTQNGEQIISGRTRAVANHALMRQHWWTFSQRGVAYAKVPKESIDGYEDLDGDGVDDPIFGNPNGEKRFGLSPIRGRFWAPNTTATMDHTWNPHPRKAGTWPHGGNIIHKGDVVQSVLPWHGDYRLVAATKHVDADVFKPHRNFGDPDIYLAHNLVNAINVKRGWGYDYGKELGEGRFDTNFRVVTGADYNRGPFPDFPATRLATKASNTYSDFDNAIANLPDGAYINKPDEGNTYVRNEGMIPYLDNPLFGERTGDTFFSPNRMISSPGVLGSLPTGVKRDIPWLTLLFRPPTLLHVNSEHPGADNPPDHLFMDLFWMPVVEPYAISEPFSTAGKVNLNYQMLPFRHITRATGLYGVMKGEIMRAIPVKAADHYLVGTRPQNIASGNSVANHEVRKDQWESMLADESDKNDDHWFYKIHMAETLKQFERRFDDGEAFKSASEICDLHLYPDTSDSKARQPTFESENSMRNFWLNHRLTGDNSREQPYTNIYPRLTTKSNTFRVHMRAQAVRKSGFTDPGVFDAERDTVLSEYRGSTLIERYIDPSDERIPDYAGSDAPLDEPGLDKFYRIRVVSSKRFDP